MEIRHPGTEATLDYPAFIRKWNAEIMTRMNRRYEWTEKTVQPIPMAEMPDWPEPTVAKYTSRGHRAFKETA